MRQLNAVKTKYGHIGRHSLLLLISGTAWIGIGISVWNTPTVNRFSSEHPNPSFYLYFMDEAWTAFIWGICGVASIVIGYLTIRPRFARTKVIGFNFILTPPLVWAFAYLWSFVTFIATHGAQGRAQSGIAIIVYTLVALFIIIVAGWPEVSPEIVQRVVTVLEDDDDTQEEL